MIGHTHILEDFQSDERELDLKRERFHRYIRSCYDPKSKCRFMIISVRRSNESPQSGSQIGSPAENEGDLLLEPDCHSKNEEAVHKSHIENEKGILYIDEKGYVEKICEIAKCPNCKVCEILSNDRELYKKLEQHMKQQQSDLIRSYTWFEDNLIVPRGSRKPNGPLYIFVDGYNVGNVERDQRIDEKHHDFIENISSCIKYLEKEARNESASIQIVVVLPKWTQFKRKKLAEEFSEFGSVEKYIHWVNIHEPELESGDDRYILEMALGRNSLIISNDNYHNLVDEKEGIWKDIIEKRVLKFDIHVSGQVSDETYPSSSLSNVTCQELASEHSPQSSSLEGNSKETLDGVAGVDSLTDLKEGPEENIERMLIYGTTDVSQENNVNLSKETKSQTFERQFQLNEISQRIYKCYLTGRRDKPLEDVSKLPLKSKSLPQRIIGSSLENVSSTSATARKKSNRCLSLSPSSSRLSSRRKSGSQPTTSFESKNPFATLADFN